jgi:hypothetical protein
MIKKVLVAIGGIVAIAIAAVLILAAGKPDTFRLARSVEVKAAPAKIALFIADFHKWPQWSPYEKMGPMERTYGGAPSGQGATYAWNGDDKVGAGRMEIVEAAPTRIAIKLDFSKPFEAHNMAEFMLDPKGDATNLTWAMSGPLTYFFKIVHTVFSMDDMVGKDFEAGLASLKALAEQQP